MVYVPMRQRIILCLTLAVVCALPAASQPRARSMFVFQNNFWVNLHQFLRGEIYRRRLAAPLDAAAPVYRVHLWPARQRDNDAWSAQAKALVDRHETAMASALAGLYHITWPREPYLVDAVGEIGPNSAVTHVGPARLAAHIQAGAASLRNTGDAPLELLFHEASHASAAEGSIRAMIDDECRRQELAVSRNLWHLMIMYTSGAIARRELAETGRPGYEPYV